MIPSSVVATYHFQLRSLLFKPVRLRRERVLRSNTATASRYLLERRGLSGRSSRD
jgi:hypothetical protein